MGNRVLSLLASFLLFPVAATADPILLGTSDPLTTVVTQAAEVQPDLNTFGVLILLPAGSFNTDATLLHGPYTLADNGTTAVLNATNQPGFDRFAQLLSNGVSNSLYWAALSVTSHTTDSLAFHLPPGVDFADSGFDITRLDVKIDFTVGPLVVPTGTISQIVFGQTLSVYGERQSAPVPEPTSVSLLGVGLAGLGLRRFRHRPKEDDTLTPSTHS